MPGLENERLPHNKSQYFGHNHTAFQYRLAQFFARFLGRLCQLDSQCIHQQLMRRYLRPRANNPRELRPSDSSYTSASASSPMKRLTNLLAGYNVLAVWWPHIILPIYLYLTYKFMLIIYYSTMRHSYTLKVAQFRSELRSKGGFLSESSAAGDSGPVMRAESGTAVAEQLAVASENLANIERRLERLGSPYEEQGIIEAAAYLIIINITLISYVVPQVYYNYVNPIGYHLLHLLESEADEFHYCRRLVNNELVNFTNSSRNFVAATWAQIQLNSSDRLSEHPELRLDRSLGRRASLQAALAPEGELAPSGLRRSHKHYAVMRLALEQHKKLVGNLRSLARHDRLLPINRSVEWFDRMVANFNQIVIGNLVYSLLLDSFIGFVLPYMADLRIHLDGSDIVTLIQMYVYLELSVLTVSFSVALAVAHLADQSQYILRLEEEIGNCMERNNGLFAEVLAFARSSSGCPRELAPKIERCSDELNVKLLESLLKYRIFIAQLRPVLDNLALVMVAALNVTVVLPIIIRCYSPYVTSIAWPLGTCFGITFIVYVNILLFPLCKFHQKGGRIYKRLWSALASAIEVNAISSDTFGRDMYAEPSVAMLRKELDHPAEVSNQFVAALLGLKATFPNLVELHFYYGIIMISLYFQLDSWRTLLGARLNDPLNLIN